MAAKLYAFRFTMMRECYGVIVAENEDAAREALESGVVDEIDCAGGETDFIVTEASRDDVESAHGNECLFDTEGGSADVESVAVFDDEGDDDATN